MPKDLVQDIHIRSWRDVYEELLRKKIKSETPEDLLYNRESRKSTILEESIDTYEAELESIAKWLNSNLGYSLIKFKLGDSEDIERLDLDNRYPQFETYIIIHGSVFEESPLGIIRLNGRNYSRSDNTSYFYKLVYYEKLRQDLINKGLYRVNDSN